MTPDAWLDAVLLREGWPTYTNRPSDRGGATRGGITYATLLGYRHSVGRTASIADLINLDVAEARAILAHWYLEPFEWAGPVLQPLLADWAVTSGPHHPIVAMQAALGVAQDGLPGPVTRQHLHDADVAEVYRHVWSERLRFYVDIVLHEEVTLAFLREEPTTQLHNLRGWLNRALEMPAAPALLADEGNAGGGRDPIDPYSRAVPGHGPPDRPG